MPQAERAGNEHAAVGGQDPAEVRVGLQGGDEAVEAEGDDAGADPDPALGAPARPARPARPPRSQRAAASTKSAIDLRTSMAWCSRRCTRRGPPCSASSI